MMFELIANGMVTLAAAFAGAWAAFKLENTRRKRDREDEEVAAGNRALFTLTVIWSSLKQYQKEYIDERRGTSDAWLNLAAGSPLGHDDLTFDMKDLSFLLQSKGSVFQQMFLEADRFHSAAQLIKSRNEIVISKVFPLFAAAGIGINDKRKIAEIEVTLGVDIVHRLKVTTAAIIKNVDEDVISSRLAYDALQSALAALYPKRKFIKMDFNPPPPIQPL